MDVGKIIPILRIFDHEKALLFYRDWLGFAVDWEHYFEPGAPVYMQVSGFGLLLHLSEHHGDGTPGSRVFVECTGLKAYHQTLVGKKYKYNRPGFEETFYGTWCVEVIDPFSNVLLFNERKPES